MVTWTGIQREQSGLVGIRGDVPKLELSYTYLKDTRNNATLNIPANTNSV